jgi:hypothetical protein
MTSASPKQRKIFTTSAISSVVTSALGVIDVMPALTREGVPGAAKRPVYIASYFVGNAKKRRQ